MLHHLSSPVAEPSPPIELKEVVTLKGYHFVVDKIYEHVPPNDQPMGIYLLPHSAIHEEVVT